MDLLTFTADIDLQARAADKPAQVSIVAYSGGVMTVPGWGPVVVDLAGLQIPDLVTLLCDHDGSRSGVVGAARARIEGSQVQLAGTISRKTEAGRQIIDLAADGIPWQASVGLTIVESQQVRSGQTVTANGQTFTAGTPGLLFVRKSKLRETSITALGADDQTSVLIKAFRGFHDMFFNKTTTSTTDTDHTDHDAAIRDQERQRMARIDAACRGDFGSQQPRVNELRAQAVAGEIPIEDLQAAVLDVLRSNRPTAPRGSGRPPADQHPEGHVIQAALMLSSGLDEQTVGEQFDERTMNAAMGRDMRGMTLHGLMDLSIRAAGHHYRGGHATDGFIRAAFEADRMLRAMGGGFSTLAVSNILENVGNKSLIAAYNAAEVAWPQIAGVISFRDFKPHSRYRLDAQGSYRKVGKDGELKHASLSDEKYTNQPDTYGMILSLSRQNLINDDLDAFMDLPPMLGRLGAVRVEEEVFKLLLSNLGSFFHADNNNLLTGAGSALAIDSLTDAKAAFMNQVDPNGKPILVTPRVLLVGTPLATTARTLIRSEKIVDGTATAAFPDGNPHAGTLELAVSAYLNNSAITDQDGKALTGQSDTQWYLFANARSRAAITVGFLNGQRTPTIESSETDFATLGMQWRAYHDFGTAFEDTRAAVKSAGA